MLAAAHRPGEGQVISCTLDQPATGPRPRSRSTSRSTAPGRRPTWSCSAGTSRRPASPPRSTSHLRIGPVRPCTAPDRGPRSTGPGTGTLSVSVAQAAGWDVPGVVLSDRGDGRGGARSRQRPTPGCTQVGGTPHHLCPADDPGVRAVDLDVRLSSPAPASRRDPSRSSSAAPRWTRLDQHVDLRRADGGGAAGPG